MSGPGLVIVRCFLFAGLLLGLATAGCFVHADEACRGCAIVHHAEPMPPAVPAGQRGLVVLLHGAFGFGPEWRPVLAALAKRPELSFFAFDWPGPFGNKVPTRAEELRITLQAAIDKLPESAREVLVLAHSAGGSLAEFAARRLVVPPGVRVHIALLDAARLNLAPYTVSPEIDTPLGMALSTIQEEAPPIPPGVDIGDYRANDPPRRPRTATSVQAPSEIGFLSSEGEHVTYLGRRVSHGASVGLVALPLLERLGR